MSSLIEVTDIYNDTRKVYDWSRPFLGDRHDHGFKILYGPPVYRPEALVIGFQPGGDVTHRRPEEQLGPSSRNEYIVEDWPLAKELRKRFGVQWLQGVVGLNIVFFRSPSTELWREIDPRLRRLNPKTVLLLGWDTLEAAQGTGFVERIATKPVLGRRRRSRLGQTGYFAGVPAVAIPYPPAAWRAPPVTDQDWKEIVALVRKVADEGVL
jgi:hypothetical protein